MKNVLMVGLLGLVLGPACVSEEDSPPNDGEDELSGESEADGEAGKADGSDNWTYFTVRADVRRCVYPICGGSFVQRVNRAYTYCRGQWTADGCYVADFDWSRTGLAEDQIQGALHGGNHVLVRGYTDNRVFDGFGNYGVFVATELWVSNSDKADEGIYARVKDNGVRCITYPCNSIYEGKLSSWIQGNIAGLDFSWSGASEDEQSKAYDALVSTDGLIITGWRYWFRGPGGWGAGRSVDQFYRRVTPAPQQACMRTGCSGQVCAAEPVVTTCEYRPEYACYADATCEVQADNQCGWTETEELAACLEDPPQP